MPIAEETFEDALNQAASVGEIKPLSDAYFSAQDTDRIKVEKALLRAMDALEAKGWDKEIFKGIAGIRMPDSAMAKGIESLMNLGAALALVSISENEKISENMRKLASDSISKSVFVLEEKERIGYLVDMLGNRKLSQELKAEIEKSCIRVAKSLGRKGSFRKLEKVINNRNSTHGIRESVNRELLAREHYLAVIEEYLRQRIVQDKKMRPNGKKGQNAEKVTSLS